MCVWIVSCNGLVSYLESAPHQGMEEKINNVTHDWSTSLLKYIVYCIKQHNSHHSIQVPFPSLPLGIWHSSQETAEKKEQPKHIFNPF